MGGIEILKNKEELIPKILQILEGKETKVDLDLDGITFRIGDIRLGLKGRVEVTVFPKTKSR